MAGWSHSELDGTYTLPGPQAERRLALQYQDLPASGGASYCCMMSAACII
jgi:two-component system sensor histidine kinase FlrB